MDAETFEEEWARHAAEQQQTFRTVFGDRKWDVLEKDSVLFESDLHLKISFALFARSYHGCTTDERFRIDSVMNKILDLSSKSKAVYINYTYISILHGTSYGILPIMRTKDENDKVYFIESERAEVFGSWLDYLQKHRIVNAEFCFPVGGDYENNESGLINLEYEIIRFSPRENVDGVKPLDVSLFFPFAKYPASYTQLSIRCPSVKTTAKKFANYFKSFTDLDSLAIWLEMIAPYFGTIKKNKTELIFMPENAKKARIAVEIFKLFYDSPFTTNGHFAVIHLMKLLAISKIRKFIHPLSEELLEMLKFICNINFGLPFDRIIGFQDVIRTLSEDHARLNDVFHLASNTLFSSFKKIEFVYGDVGILRILNLITKSMNDNQLIDSLRLLALTLINIVVKKNKTKATEFGILASKVIHDLKHNLCEAFLQEMKKLRQKLCALLNYALDTEEYRSCIYNYSIDKLLIIFNSVKKVSAALKGSTVENICESQFLKVAFTFLDMLEDHVNINDVFSFVSRKFITQYRADLIETNWVARVDAVNDFEVLFNNFTREFAERPNMNKLLVEFREINQISIEKIIENPIIDLKGMSIGMRQINEKLQLLDFANSQKETVIYKYLQVDVLSTTDIYVDGQVVVCSKNDYIFLCFVLNTREELNYDIGINIFYTIPT